MSAKRTISLFNTSNIPKKTKFTVEGFIHEAEEEISEFYFRIPTLIVYIVLAYYFTTIEFLAVPCAAFTLSENRKTVTKVDDCGCSLDYLLSTDCMPINFNGTKIYSFEIKSIDTMDDLKVSLIGVKDEKDFKKAAKYVTMHGIISMWDIYDDEDEPTEAQKQFADIRPGDIVTFILNTVTRNVYVAINKQAPVIVKTNIDYNVTLNYTLAIQFGEITTSICIIEPDVIEPSHKDSAWRKIHKFEAETCFCCGEKLDSHGLQHYILHLKEDYQQKSKPWLVCDIEDCADYGKLFSRGRNFIWHMWKHFNVTPYKCIIKTNGKLCNKRFGRKDVLLTHTNNIDYKHYGPITENNKILQPDLSVATYDNCVIEHGSCPRCNKKFDSWVVMKDHMSNECYLDKTCGICKKQFTPNLLLINLQKCYNFKVLHCNGEK